MAKCMRLPGTNTVKRVSNEEADDLHKKGWEYIGKSEYHRILNAPPPRSPAPAKAASYVGPT